MSNWTNTLEMLSEMTEYNDHTGALVLGCEKLKTLPNGNELDSLYDELVSLEYLRDNNSWLFNLFYDYKYELYQKLMKFAKDNLTPNDYDSFYSCY